MQAVPVAARAETAKKEKVRKGGSEDDVDELKNIVQLKDMEMEEYSAPEKVITFSSLEPIRRRPKGLSRVDTEIFLGGTTLTSECNFCPNPTEQELQGTGQKEAINTESSECADLPKASEADDADLTIQMRLIPSEDATRPSTKHQCPENAGTLLCVANSTEDPRISATLFSSRPNKLHKHRIQPCTRCSTCVRRQSIAESRTPRRVSSSDLPRKVSVESFESGNNPYSKAARWVKKYGKKDKRAASDTWGVGLVSRDS